MPLNVPGLGRKHISRRGNEMGSETARRSHWSRLGIWLDIIYIAIVAGAYAFASTGKPDEFGHRWLPYFMLAMSWYIFTEPLLLPNSILGCHTWFHPECRTSVPAR